MALTQINSEGIKDGEIKDADVNASAAIAGSKLAAATTSVPGSMSAADKTKLDGVATSATANPSAPALTGSTNNTICTVTGANAIQGEANLTFDGNNLKVTAGSEGNSASLQLIADEGDDAADNWRLLSNASDNALTISSSESTERLRIDSSGNVKITDGDLVIGSAGHGIDFSDSQTNAAGMTSELLDHYEEGSFTATPADAASGGNASSTTFTGYYIRIGKQVTIFVRMLNVDSTGLTGANDLFLQGIPFTSGNLTNMEFVGAASVHADTTADSTAYVSNILDNDNFVRFYEQRENTSRDYLRCQEINDATTDIIFTLTYIAAS